MRTSVLVPIFFNNYSSEVWLAESKNRNRRIYRFMSTRILLQAAVYVPCYLANMYNEPVHRKYKSKIWQVDSKYSIMTLLLSNNVIRLTKAEYFIYIPTACSNLSFETLHALQHIHVKNFAPRSTTKSCNPYFISLPSSFTNVTHR